MNKSFLPENLYNLRREHGLSQEEFAERLGVSRQAVSKWERAEAYPDTENLIAISELLSVTIDDLLRSEVSKNSEDSIVDSGTNDVGKTDNEHVGNPSVASILSAVPYPTVVTLAFLLLGFLLHAWYWAWTLFLSVPVYYSFIGAIRKRRLASFAYPPFTAFMFCLFGMLYNIWHPMWLIFLTVPIYYPIANAIDRYIAARKQQR